MVSVMVNTVVNLDYRMRPLDKKKKKKKQVGSAGNSGRLQHQSLEKYMGKTRVGNSEKENRIKAKP